jgi:hypothetical protein
MAEKLLDKDYQILGLSPEAKPAEVKKAFRALAKQWHPDSFQGQGYVARSNAEEKFREIAGAYRRVSEAWEPGGKRSRARSGGGPGPRSEPAVPPSRFRLDIGRGWRIRAAACALILAFIVAGAYLPLPSLTGLFSGPDEPGPKDEAAAPGPASVETAEAPSPEAPPVPEGRLSGRPPGPAAPDPDPLLPAEPPPPAWFSIGSSQTEVVRVQGQPSRIQGQVWVYGLSEIHFRQGRVWGYDNFDGSLRVRVQPQETGGPGAFVTLGSTSDEVLHAHGTPTRIENDRWYYGFSEIHFKDGRVSGFDNYFGNLKIQMLPSSAAAASTASSAADAGEKPATPAFFTIGSSRDEVLAVQGTPSSVQGNLWSYGFSSVMFRDGKVRYVLNTDGGLRFRTPEEIASAGAKPGP